MARDWESTFRDWSKPSSDTEEQKCENAERMIRDSIKESSSLADKNIEIFPQGSYRNNTNVRQDSDVDICVRCLDVIFTDFSMASGFSIEDVGLVDADYTYSQFKNELANALEKILIPIQEKYKAYRNSEELIQILNDGAKEASIRASKKLIDVKNKLGLNYNS